MKKKPRLVRKNSAIHGKGVYAKTAIDRGIVIVEYKGKRRRWSAFKGKDKFDYAFLMYTEKGVVIDPRRNGNIAVFINHSCEPNCQAVLIEDRVYIETLRKIKAGEEITYNYGLTLGKRPSRKERLMYPCQCGASKCRETLLK